MLRIQRGIELHGDLGSLWISNWFQFDGTLEHAPCAKAFAPVPLLRQPEGAMSWAVGIDDLAVAVTEGRPPRAVGSKLPTSSMSWRRSSGRPQKASHSL